MKKTLTLLVTTIALSAAFWSCQSNVEMPDAQHGTSHSGARGGAGKVAIIHNGKVIMVSENAAGAHLGHGDALAADFKTFYIRNNNRTISAPWDEDMKIFENQKGDGFSFLTPQGGQKVGYGTNAFDGMPINQIESADWNPVSVFTNPGRVPYLNIWVTDGTNYAIIASEFSAVNGNYQGKDFGTRREWKVFEYNTIDQTPQDTTDRALDWLFAGVRGTRDVNQYLIKGKGANAIKASFDDFADNIIIASPTAPYPSYVGTGAPRGGYGFNLIYGDTFSNFADGPQTYPNQLDNLTVTAKGRKYAAINF